jgi:hypothetical protein
MKSSVQRNKLAFILIVIAFLLGLGAAAAAYNIEHLKNVYRYYKQPKLYDARRDLLSLKGPTINPEFKVFVASSLDRILLDGRTLVKPSYNTQAVISAAGNEYESFQVVVNSLKDVSGVRLEFSDLVNSKSGKHISYEALRWRAVGYVPTRKPYYPVKFVGLWPDPLISIESYEIKAMTTQPFWVTLYVPPDTPSGEYTGTIKVKSSGFADQIIPLRLTVYGFTIPKKSHLKTAFDFYGHLTKLRYPQLPDEPQEIWKERIEDVNEKFIRTMIDYRMDPILNIDPTSVEDMERVSLYMQEGLTNFAIGKKGGTFDNNWPKTDEEIEKLLPLYETYGKLLEDSGLLDHTYLYTWDEGEIGNPLVAKVSSMVHRAHPKLKNMVCYHGFWDPFKDPNWGKDIDIWTFQIDKFDEKKMRALQERGVEVWMYVSGPSSNETPNLVIDMDSIYYRILPWMCWKYDIKGFLYWCVNWWPNVDPFEDAKNSDWEQNGNGLLFYPGPEGPLASIRTELFRDGMEDYEYIQILLEKLRFLRAQGLEAKYPDFIKKSMSLLTIDPRFIASPAKFVKKGDLLKHRRNSIAKMIEEFEHLNVSK